MPTEKFLKLKKNKKDLIYRGIKELLAKKNYTDISASDIIEEIGISRGSFYSYFVDKKDSVKAYILYYGFIQINLFKERILQNNGDYFKAIREMYYYSKEEAIRTNANFIVSNLQFVSEVIVELLEDDDTVLLGMSYFTEWCLEHIPKDYFNVKCDNERMHYINVLSITAVINTLSNFFRYEILKKDNSKVDSLLDIQLEIIRNGA
ncbi:MAG: TetR/AcrR family transcriptional regulator [Eubacteriales bacterium]|nr:TetR/AcrR family transcriptional regulator [Eubacteriales bacterium]